MKIPCEVIRDLLPLYVDGVCSEESRNTVEEHLQNCKACREELRLMKGDIQSTPPQTEEEEPVKAAAAAWKRGKHKAFLKGGVIALVIAGLVAAILCHCLVPVSVSSKSFKTGDIFQHRILRWGLSETTVRLMWGKQMEENFLGVTRKDYEQELGSRQSCTLNGERGDILFLFRHDELSQIQMWFRNISSDEWGPQLLEEFREYYGPETRTIETNGKILYYVWELGDSNMLFSTGEYGLAEVVLIESKADAM